MKYRTFGKVPWQCSSLGFGTMRLPMIGTGPAIDEEKTIPLLRAGIDLGINYIDTAYTYNDGASEIVVGKALLQGYRQKVRIATKLPSWLVQTRADMDRCFEQQLERLQVPHVDFYLLHSMDSSRWPRLRDAGVLEWLEERRGRGQIKHAGFSFHDAPQAFAPIADGYDWEFCQIQFNYLDEHNQAGLAGLDHAAAKGLAVIVMEPLRGGILANPAPEIAALWVDNRFTPAQHGLRWVWNHPQVATVLSGMNSLEQVRQNVAAADSVEPGSLSGAELAAANRARQAYLSKTTVPCTGCKYCQPCPQGVDIPTMFALANDGAMFDNWDHQRRRYHWVKKGNTSPEACTNCGLCAEKCPQRLEIPRLLQEVKAKLENAS